MSTIASTYAHEAGTILVNLCHGAARAGGWWSDADIELVNNGSRLGKLIVSQKLALVHSEISEALEGLRKDLKDDHLPHRLSIEVELADAVIRIADLAGAMGLDLGGAIADKMEYNSTRQDHRPEARAAAGGKSF